MRLLYLVHDLNHADIARRVELLQAGGAEVVLAGFHRKEEVDPGVANVVAPLGRTRDGAFLQRIVQVVRAAMGLGRLRGVTAGCDAVLARNLEMLLLGVLVRARLLRAAPLTYECLDIHRLMTGRGLVGRALRRLEGDLMRRCQCLVTSSPGFVSEYFAKLYRVLPRVILVENKVFPALEGARAAPQPLPDGPPWRIGWFGVIRCRRSLEILSDLAAAAPGLIEVVVSGRPAKAVFGDVEAAFADRPGVTFVGGFADEAALAAHFRSVHFAWAMDFYEAGANSDWLLPNRLYRAVYYGAVPIALSGVETGRWLAGRGLGLRVDTATSETLRHALEQTGPDAFATMRAALGAVPTADLVTLDAECREIVCALAGTARRGAAGADED